MRGDSLSDLDYDLSDRLHNWGAYCRINPDAPNSSCCNPMYEQMIPDDETDGYGEITADTVTVPQLEPAKAEMEIDERDADQINGFVHQLAKGFRGVLVTRYVLQMRPGTPSAKDALLAAKWALQTAMRDNRRVVDRMRGAA